CAAAQLYIVPAHVSEMFSTHPATEKRIAALQDMAGDYAPPAPAPASSRRSALDPLG
ncbi:MAG: protease HtpX, partial [Sphingomonadaceae bacterium]|nr:protease HtpX [Sphingomonadaceae bacterium]